MAVLPGEPYDVAVISDPDGRLPRAEDERDFWALIEAAWTAAGPDAHQARRVLAGREHGAEPDTAIVDGALGRFLAELASRCEGLSGENLTRLDRVLERKLYDIDREDVHEFTDGSDDGFLYARSFIVALGRDFYQAVAAEPALAIADAECEEMCYFFAQRYRERFDRFPDTASGISRESCANPAGWPA